MQITKACCVANAELLVLRGVRPDKKRKENPPTNQSEKKSPTPELEVSKKLKVSKKSEAPKLKGITIGSPRRDKPPTPPAPVLGKGKGKLIEHPHPAKKQKPTPILEQRQLTPTPEQENWREFNSQLHLRLHQMLVPRAQQW